MQLYVLLIVLGLLAGQGGVLVREPRLGGWAMAAASVGPYVLIALPAWLGCVATRKAMSRRPERAMGMVNRLHLTLTMLRWAAVGVFFTSLFVLGYLDWLKAGVGSIIMAPDLIALAGPMLTVVFMWWAYYPIDRRLREAMLIRQLDMGEPTYALPTRGGYVWDQLRHQVLIILGPMLLVLLWVQTVAWATDRWMGVRPYEALLLVAGGVGVFALAPLIIRLIWNTTPMPDGPLRQRLLELCRVHRVRVRELLLWHTHGGQINGAVMGLVGPLRYILLTDGLVERLPDREVEAVMAHELGHVRRKHMPWMAVCALGTLGAMFMAVEQAAALIDTQLGWDGLHRAVITAGIDAPDTTSSAIAGAALLGTLAAWGAAFGYISRRFERQADTFAVQHLARQYPEQDGEPDTIGPRAVHGMAAALQNVCRLNHSPTNRPSWRHGSIDWRIDYLRSLVGTPINDCPIDRKVRRLCLLGAGLMLVTMGIEFLTLR